MTTSVYAPAGTISDVYGRDDAAGGGATIPSPQILAAGFDDIGKSGTAGYNSFLRFEIDIPDDATIQGFALRLVTSQTHQATTWDFRFGLIDPNHAKSDGLWTNSDGFHQSNYPTMFDLPHPTSEKGAEPPTNDVTVFFESTPAFTLVDWTPPAKDTDITMHEGTQTGVHSVSGFIAKLERYLADPTMTSFRDGGSGLLPICITIGWEPEALPLADYWQQMYSTNPGTPVGWEPQLTIDWEAPPPTTGFGATAQSDAVAQVAARSGAIGQVSAQSDVVSMAVARSDAQPQVTASSDVVDQVKARGD
jgi:hypothetical protein